MKQGAYAGQHPPPLYPAPLRPPALPVLSTSLLTVLAETPTITPKPTPFLELLLCVRHFVALCLCSDLAGGPMTPLLCRAGSSSDRHGRLVQSQLLGTSRVELTESGLRLQSLELT